MTTPHAYFNLQPPPLLLDPKNRTDSENDITFDRTRKHCKYKIKNICAHCGF